MCAKNGRSRMNDAHTISTADLVGLPAKVVRPDSLLFWILSRFLYDFCIGHRPADLGVST